MTSDCGLDLISVSVILSGTGSMFIHLPLSSPENAICSSSFLFCYWVISYQLRA